MRDQLDYFDEQDPKGAFLNVTFDDLSERLQPVNLRGIIKQAVAAASVSRYTCW